MASKVEACSPGIEVRAQIRATLRKERACAGSRSSAVGAERSQGLCSRPTFNNMWFRPLLFLGLRVNS